MSIYIRMWKQSVKKGKIAKYCIYLKKGLILKEKTEIEIATLNKYIAWKT